MFKHNYELMDDAPADGAPAAAGGDAPAAPPPSDSLLDGIEGDGADALDFSKGKPEGFPDDAWDEEANGPKADILYTKLQDAEKRAKGLRDKLARGEGKPPKDASEYTFTPPEESASIFKDGDINADPVVAATKEIAHKYGMTKEAYAGFMAEMSGKIAELAQSNQSADMTDEQRAEYRRAELEKIGPNAMQVVRAVESWGRELKASGQFSEADAEAFKSMALTGDQVRVLNKLRAIAGGGNSIPTNISDDGLPSDDEIATMAANIKSEADERKLNELLDRRRAAGRPDRLQIR